MDRSVWAEHLRAYRRSGLSARRYAREHGLVYHQLLYRVRKAAEAPGPSSAFMAVTASDAGRSAVLGVVSFPNGVRVEIHDASLLPALSEWVVSKA